MTLWHLGRDSITTYTGPRYDVTWQVAVNSMLHAYSKEFDNGKVHHRLEKEENPGIMAAEAAAKVLG